MVRNKRTGSERLVSTSVHLPCEYLDRMEETGYSQYKSTFIRDAVGEKLEKEEGFIAAINRQKKLIENLEIELEIARSTLDGYAIKHTDWERKKEIADIKANIVAEYLTGRYSTELELYDAMKLSHNTSLDLKELIHEVWEELRIDKRKEK